MITDLAIAAAALYMGANIGGRLALQVVNDVITPDQRARLRTRLGIIWRAVE